jgi:filamin
LILSAIEVGEPRPITINTLSTAKPDAPCFVSVTNPRGQTAELPTKPGPEGYTTTFAPVEPGPHKVNVAFAGQELPKSPYPVKVEPRANVGAVTVRGLEKRKLAHG